MARYYNVPLWSKEHFDLMRPIMKMLADVGQDAITASIMHKPWNGQTEDHYDSMIGRIKKLDGTWSYDYTVFDKWVTFMREDIGIDGLISCYTMIPWAMRFDYYDQATSRIQFIEAQPDEQAYKDYWLPFLKDFRLLPPPARERLVRADRHLDGRASDGGHAGGHQDYPRGRS